MTTRRPPPGPPPRLDTYRPSDERSGPPSRPPQGYPMQAPPPPGYPPHGQLGEPYPPRRGPGLPPPPMPPRHRAPAYPGAHAPRKPRRKAGIGTMLLYGGLGLGAMVMGAAAFAAMTLPASFVRDRAVAAVKDATGRDLVIAGPTSFSFFPSLAISFSDVSLSGDPAAAPAKPLLTMKAFDVSVAFWPLLKREVRVNALTLREPEIYLDVDAEGRRSWDFADASQSHRVRLAQASTGPATVSDADSGVSGVPRKTLRLSNLALDNVQVDNGRVIYSDARTGRTSEFSEIRMRLAAPALTESLDLEGNLAWKGRTVHYSGALTSLSDVLDERPAKLRLAIGADVLDASFEGKAEIKTLATEGILSANSSSARALFNWLGTDLPPSRGFGALTAKGLWRSAPDSYAFTTAEVVLDGTTAVGDIKLDTRGARPFIEVDLKLSELDLNAYASRGEEAPASPRATGSGEGSPRSIEDLIGETAPPGPRVKGYTKRDGWDEDPFDLALLGAVDANARLSVGKLTVGALHLDQSDLNVALKNRVMTTTLDRVSLYEGAGIGTVMLDGTAGTRANLAIDVKLEGVSALPLFKDTLEIDRLAGKGRVALTLVGQGSNQREIVETLNGRASLAFADGAIIGINVPEMIRSLSKGNLGGLNTAPTDRTDFSEMTSTWTVKGGVAENEDLKLVSPLLRLSGSGRVALPTRHLDYTLRPRIVASLEGQGSARPDAAGIEVPVHVEGPWDDPKFKPDVAGALNNPKTVEAIKEIGKQFKGKKTDEIVNDLLSGDSKTRKAKGKQLLEQFLNKDKD